MKKVPGTIFTPPPVIEYPANSEFLLQIIFPHKERNMKFKKIVGSMVVFSFIALASRRGRRCLCAFAGVFAKQKLLCLITAGMLLLSTCSNPFASNDEKEYGTFTITLNTGNNSRAVVKYPPNSADLANLKFIVNFTPLGSKGTAKSFTAEGTSAIKGKLDLGDYKVTYGGKGTL